MRQTTNWSLEAAQQLIYDFFLGLVRNHSPEKFLLEFKRLFINYQDVSDQDVYNALGEVIIFRDEAEFKHTLQRCCYIFVNNLNVQRNHQFVYIQNLVDLFQDSIIDQPTNVTKFKILRSWIKSFINSENYEVLKLYSISYTSEQKRAWCNRFNSYLLVSQYANPSKPEEQRQIADELAKKLKGQFKLDLAMYTARLKPNQQTNTPIKNPTSLGDQVLSIAKIILTRRGEYSYRNLANVFLKKIQEMTFKEFKYALINYLDFPYKDDIHVVKNFEKELVAKIYSLHPKDDDKRVSTSLIYKVCTRVVDYLTIDYDQPSKLFILLLDQGNPLALVILFLRILLICQYIRTHIEAHVAEIINYYSEYPESECESLINFLDILNVTFAIYSEDTEYNLIRMYDSDTDETKLFDDNYRIFSQVKSLEKSSKVPKDQSQKRKQLEDRSTASLQDHQITQLQNLSQELSDTSVQVITKSQDVTTKLQDLDQTKVDDNTNILASVPTHEGY